MHRFTHDRSDRIDRAALCRRARDAFVHTFGTEPTASAVAPGRVNLIGEHTDYNDGFVLPMAIDRAIVVTAGLREDGPWRIVSQTLNCRIDADPDCESGANPPSVAPFARYVLGVAAVLTERGATLPAVDLLIDSTLPPGGGLSSSAALTVATCMTLEQLAGFTLETHDRARCCQHVEHVYAGTPCGIMDPLACILGRRDHALRIDCRSLDVRPVKLPPEDEITWLVVDCGERHTLADSAYADRQRDCRTVTALLGVPSLRAADTAALAGTWLAPRLRDRAQHVVEENGRVDRFIASLERRDWAGLGTTMFESHDSLRALYDVSCPALDTIVDAAGAMVDRGVVGARMTGGGFGGYAIVACRSEAAPEVEAGLAEVAGASAVSRVRAGDGASVVEMASEPGL